MKLRARDEISSKEEQAIRAAISEEREYRSDHTFIKAGVELSVSTLLLDGLMCRYKDLRSGERQISELHVPGDFADLLLGINREINVIHGTPLALQD